MPPSFFKAREAEACINTMAKHFVIVLGAAHNCQSLIIPPRKRAGDENTCRDGSQSVRVVSTGNFMGIAPSYAVSDCPCWNFDRTALPVENQITYESL